MPGYSTGEAKPVRSSRKTRDRSRRACRAFSRSRASLGRGVPVCHPLRVRGSFLQRFDLSGVSSAAPPLRLWTAGVPIKAPVAGISCGLITEDDGTWMTMIDIQGLEDFYGDMDFKVAGTHKGITSIQMDLKIDGLTPEIITAGSRRLPTRDAITSSTRSFSRRLPSRRRRGFRVRAQDDQHEDQSRRRSVTLSDRRASVIQKIQCRYRRQRSSIEEDGSVFIAARQARRRS